MKHTAPMLAGLSANLLVQALDVWFIAQLGSDALTAMGFIFPVAMVFIYLAIGLSAGAASLVARKAVEFSPNQLNQLILHIQLLACLIAMFAVGFCWLFIDRLFLVIGAEPAVLPLINDYLPIFYINGFLTIVSMAGLSSIRALGNTKMQGMAMVAAAFVHALLDPFLIFGLGIFEGYGMQGAAMAGAISKIIPLAVAIYALHKKLAGLVFDLHLTGFFRSSRAVLYVALPAIGNNLIIPFSAFMTTALVARFGAKAVAGFAIAANIEPIMLLVFHALSSVVGPYMGQNFAAKRFERIRAANHLICRFSLLSGCLMTGGLWFFGRTIASWFSADEAIIDVASWYLSIIPISYGFSGVVILINSSFNGIGKPVPAAIISALRAAIIYLPLAFMGSWLFALKGVLVAYSFVNILCALIAYCWFQNVIRHDAARAME